MRALLFLMVAAAQSALAGSGTCTWTATDAALSLSCAGAEAPPPPPPPPPVVTPVTPPTNCVTPSYTATFTYPGQFFEYSLANGQVAALKMPETKRNGWVESLVFQSTGTPSDLEAVGTISGQPGCISTTVPACSASGSAWSSIDLHGQTGNPGGNCPIGTGLVYYMNVTVTNCAQDRCTIRTQYWGGGQ